MCADFYPRAVASRRTSGYIYRPCEYVSSVPSTAKGQLAYSLDDFSDSSSSDDSDSSSDEYSSVEPSSSSEEDKAVSTIRAGKLIFALNKPRIMVIHGKCKILKPAKPYVPDLLHLKEVIGAGRLKDELEADGIEVMADCKGDLVLAFPADQFLERPLKKLRKHTMLALAMFSNKAESLIRRLMEESANLEEDSPEEEEPKPVVKAAGRPKKLPASINDPFYVSQMSQVYDSAHRK